MVQCVSNRGRWLRSGAVLLLSTALLIRSGWPHDVVTTKLTYNTDVSRIFAKRCVSCHDTSSSIPLSSYTQVRPWAVAIKEQVLSRSMPPSGVVKGFGPVSPEDALSGNEMMVIASWVLGGAPQGNQPIQPTNYPPLPKTRFATMGILFAHTTVALKKETVVNGFHPSSKMPVESVKVMAMLPDGTVEPVIWLYKYDPRYNKEYEFTNALRFPKGTLIEASQPLDFSLETTKP